MCTDLIGQELGVQLFWIVFLLMVCSVQRATNPISISDAGWGLARVGWYDKWSCATIRYMAFLLKWTSGSESSKRVNPDSSAHCILVYYYSLSHRWQQIIYSNLESVWKKPQTLQAVPEMDFLTLPVQCDQVLYIKVFKEFIFLIVLFHFLLIDIALLYNSDWTKTYYLAQNNLEFGVFSLSQCAKCVVTGIRTRHS